jgi:tetratricopeptide (TPR) repeat protein
MKDASTYNFRATAYAAKQDYRRAISDLTEAIALKPMDVTVHGSEALVFKGFVSVDERFGAQNGPRLCRNPLISCCSTRERLPMDTPLYLTRAAFHAAQKDFAAALADFNEALRLSPKDPNVYLNRGIFHLARRDYERALADFDQAIRLAPQHPIAHYNRGNAYLFAREDFEHAIEDFKAAIRINPNFMYAYFSLAHVLATCPKAKLRDGKKAVEYAKKGCDISRWKDPGGLTALAVAYAEMGDFNEAIKWQKKALESAHFFSKEQQEEMRTQLKLFEQGKPYRKNWKKE